MRKIALNSAIQLSPLKVTDTYNKQNGYVFPLRFKPWLDFTTYDKDLNEFGYMGELPDGETSWIAVPIFTITINGEENSSITDLTDYFNFNIPVLPQETEGYYFYYSEGKLYFNFDLIEAGNLYTVSYYSTSDSISLSIELDKFNHKVPRVDSFEMEMIGINVK